MPLHSNTTKLTLIFDTVPLMLYTSGKMWAQIKITKTSGKFRNLGFTIVELLIVIVVIGILAAISIVAYSGVQSRARDSARLAKINSIAKAIELYNTEKGRYPAIQDGIGRESTCGSQTESWGHCDRNKELADLLAPYLKIDPTSLSDATQGSNYYHYTSQSTDNFQSYGMMVFLEGSGGQNDGGYFSNALEIGSKPSYCVGKYTGTAASWTTYSTMCSGGN